MAMVDVSPFFFPENAHGVQYGNGTNGAAATLDVVGDYYALVAYAKQDMTITHIWFDANAVSGSPTGELRIETVDASTGFPTGTLWATNTTTGTTPTLTTTGTAFALTASATITKGQCFAVKILYISGTSFTVGSLSQALYRQNSNYFVDNSTGTPAKANPTSSLRLGVGNSATTFYSVDAIIPQNGKTSNSVNNTNSAAIAAHFQIPFKARCCGFVWQNALGSLGDFNLVLWDDAGNELNSSSTPIDGDTNTLAVAGGLSTAIFDNPVVLSPATLYRIGLEPSTATNTSIDSYTYTSTIRGQGINFPNQAMATRTSGVWSDSATDVIGCCLILDQVDDGA